MKFSKLGFLTLSLATTLAINLSANAATINFDDLNTRNNFASLGISNTYQGYLWSSSTSSGGNEGWAVATTTQRISSETYAPASGNGYGWNWNGTQSLFIDFQGAVNVDGAYFANIGASYGSNASFVQMLGYDSIGNVVAQSGLGAIGNSFQYLNANFSNIHKLEIRANAASKWFAVDDIQVSAVPEPETYALLLAGLGLVGGVVRRRKQKATAV